MSYIIGNAIERIGHRGHEGVAYVIGGCGLLGSIFGAIDLNSVQAWFGAAVALAAVIWGFWRDQKRRDFDAEERRKLIETLVAATIEAAKSGKDTPYLAVLINSLEGESEKPAPAKPPSGPGPTPVPVPAPSNGKPPGIP